MEYAGNPVVGRQLLRQAARIHRALYDRSGLLHALNNLAEGEYGAGHAERAVEIASEAIEIGMNNNDQPAVMLTRSNLAGYLLALGAVDEAERSAKESLRDERSVGGRPNYVAWTMHHLALVAAKRGQFERAARLLGYIDVWYQANKDPPRDFNEQTSHDCASALVAAALAEDERTRLMGEGAAWTEEEATEQALKI
jgi:tetratricopeptide (TPR) repeat protein